MYTPLPFCWGAGAWGGGGTSYQVFKKGALDRTLISRGRWVGKKEVGDLFEVGGGGGCGFYMKTKLKSEIFNEKKVK